MTKDFDALIEKNVKVLTEINSKIAPLEKSADSARRRIRALKEEKDQYILDSIADEDELIPFLLFEDGAASGVRYKKADEYFRSLGFGYSMGYNAESQQRGVSISLVKGDENSLKIAESAINKVLPHLRCISVDGDKVKIIHINEHTCSEHGTYDLYFTEKDIQLVKHRYYSKYIEKTFRCLTEALKYVQKNHFYEKFEDAA